MEIKFGSKVECVSSIHSRPFACEFGYLVNLSKYSEEGRDYRNDEEKRVTDHGRCKLAQHQESTVTRPTAPQRQPACLCNNK